MRFIFHGPWPNALKVAQFCYLSVVCLHIEVWLNSQLRQFMWYPNSEQLFVASFFSSYFDTFVGECLTPWRDQDYLYVGSSQLSKWFHRYFPWFWSATTRNTFHIEISGTKVTESFHWAVSSNSASRMWTARVLLWAWAALIMIKS